MTPVAMRNSARFFCTQSGMSRLGANTWIDVHGETGCREFGQEGRQRGARHAGLRG